MPTQAEIIAAGRVLISEPEVSKMLHLVTGTEWAAVLAARVIATKLLVAAENMRARAYANKHEPMGM